MEKELIITRVVNAPKQLVFDAFTKAEHLAHWWGSAGCVLKVLKLNVTPGGQFHYVMQLPDGNEIYGLFNYKEVNAPDSIAFTSAFSDKEGNITTSPFPMDFPLEVYNTWTFTENDGKTTITLKGKPYHATAEQINTFSAIHDNMNEGFNKTFDQLDAYIAANFQLRKENKQSKAARTSTYLNFNGNTEEAFNFYKAIFRTEFSGEGIKRFESIPPMEGGPIIGDEIKKMILHVELPILGGHVLMATDAPESMGFTLNSGNNVHINLEPESRAETTRLFEALSEGGTITMPLVDMFFGAYYGSCTDKFGINWMVHYTA
jgi:PhnB protein